jgi:hypothetical protein
MAQFGGMKIMIKLNQIIAIEAGVKASTQKDMTAAYHAVQKQELMNGLARNYKPKDDEGDQLPSESKRVQVTALDILRSTEDILTKLYDVTATKDWANCTACADVKIGDRTVLSQVPVPYLLFLEKRLLELETVVKTIPTLDPSEQWNFDPAQAVFASAPTQTTRTKKIPRNHVKAEATKEHPAQVEIFNEDVIIGTWTTVKYSGALPVQTSKAILERISKLRDAVKFAREEANSIEATPRKVGAILFEYLLAPMRASE